MSNPAGSALKVGLVFFWRVPTRSTAECFGGLALIGKRSVGGLSKWRFFGGGEGFVLSLLDRRAAFVSTVARAVEIAQCFVFKPRRHKNPFPVKWCNSWIKATFVYK